MTEAIVINSNTHKACVYIIDHEWNYLLQRRSTNMADGSSGRLALFGWGVDSGETVVQWLTRELMEELELDISLCTVDYVWQHVSSTGVIFEIFEVQMNQSQDLVLHEGDEIVKIAREQLYDQEITWWFEKINQVYLDD